MTIAVFGGSFDPPHVGHVLAAHYVMSVGLVDRVLVVPVFQHPFGKAVSPFSTRMEMCQRAFEGDERIEVSAVESSLPEPSYMLRTLEALHAQFPSDEFRLVIGADVLAEVEKWHQFDEVCRLAPLLVLGRAGSDHPDAPPAVLPQVSSTEARSWFRADATEEEHARRKRLIPEGVRDVIERAGLYQSLQQSPPS